MVSYLTQWEELRLFHRLPLNYTKVGIMENRTLASFMSQVLGTISQGRVKIVPAPECGGEVSQSPVFRVANETSLK